MKYEGIKDDENIVHYFENLLINIHNGYISEFKLFYSKLKQLHTLIGELQSFDSLTIINNLADNAFKCQIILCNKIVSPIISIFHVFNFLINLQYDDIKFKRSFIDSNISTQSIKSIGQLKVL